MTLNGKGDDFTLADFRACAKAAMLKRGRDKAMLDEVREAVSRWPKFAAQAGVDQTQVKRIARAHRLRFPEK